MSIALQADTHTWKATGRGDLARLMRRARRHSAQVRLMRIGVPLATIGGLTLVILAVWLNPLRGLASMPMPSVGKVLISGTKVTMEAPKLSGYTRDNRPYNVTAEAAAQDFLKPEVIELTGIKATVELQGKNVVDIKAVQGLYDTKSELLTLSQYIFLTSTTGYEGHLTEAVMDVKKGYIVSEKPVEVVMLGGKINSNRLEVIDNGALLRFDNGVDMTITPSAMDKSAKR